MSEPFPSPALASEPAGPSESNIQITHVIYALYALGLLSLGIIAVAGLIMAYIKRDDVACTYLAPHMSWLIRTFWWAFGWCTLIWIFIFATLGIGLLVAWLFFGIVWIWVAYRIIKGWLRLAEKRAI